MVVGGRMKIKGKKAQVQITLTPEIVKNAAGKILYHNLELPQSASWPEMTERMISEARLLWKIGKSLVM